MLKRTLTGAVILILTVAFVLLKMISPFFFDAYALIISYGALIEISKAYKLAKKEHYFLILVFVPILLFVIFAFEKSILMALVYVLLLAMLIIVLCLTLDIVSFAKNRKNGTTEPDVSVLNSSLFNKTKQTLMIFAYPLLPLGFLFAINHLNFTLSFVGIVLAFAVSMLTDTCAYLIGRACGKNKFIPEVSPNKTVEGVVGGFIGGIVGAILCFVIFYFANIFDFASINVLWKLILSFAIVGILGSYINQLGDLVASAFKRKVGIKDFSNIFPGHGGFMDRVDGLMFTMTFTFIIFVLVLV